MGQTDQVPRIVIDLGESMWDTIAHIRDAAHRDPRDADTDEIVAALWPLIGRFLRDAAGDHLAAARDNDDEDMTPTGRSMLMVKAQALADLADKADPEHRGDTVALFA